MVRVFILASFTYIRAVSAVCYPDVTHAIINTIPPPMMNYSSTMDTLRIQILSFYGSIYFPKMTDMSYLHQ